ncbi:homoserine dehydrogenase [Candidatus Peregrinibacteria bacterium]|nr:MAG: homoserine dehydrogenase [Candidatus Peregrinibacteria bacterium]
MLSTKVAIFGHGNIGGGVSRILLADQKRIEQEYGVHIELVAICTKDPEPDLDFAKQYHHLFVEAEDVFQREDISIVCETIGGVGVAKTFVQKALESGKHVVTANKKLIAEHFEELSDTAQKNNVHLLFEAAVGGGIPLLSTISQGLSGDVIQKIEGIMNGTTNFILTDMGNSGADFQESLQKAQKSGFSEADPTDDVEGYDTTSKLSILIAKAFGRYIPPKDIPRLGISRVTAADFLYAEILKKKIKLLVHAEQKEDGVIAEVSPVLLPESSSIAHVDGVLNALRLTGKYNTAGNMFVGEGAGRFPTAAALVSDMISIARGSPNPCTEVASGSCLSPSKRAYYFRFLVNDRPGLVGEIGVIFGKYGISIDAVHQAEGQSGDIHFVITTFPVEWDFLKSARKEIEACSFHVEPPFVLPIWK